MPSKSSNNRTKKIIPHKTKPNTTSMMQCSAASSIGTPSPTKPSKTKKKPLKIWPNNSTQSFVFGESAPKITNIST